MDILNLVLISAAFAVVITLALVLKNRGTLDPASLLKMYWKNLLGLVLGLGAALALKTNHLGTIAWAVLMADVMLAGWLTFEMLKDRISRWVLFQLMALMTGVYTPIAVLYCVYTVWRIGWLLATPLIAEGHLLWDVLVFVTVVVGAFAFDDIMARVHARQPSTPPAEATPATDVT